MELVTIIIPIYKTHLFELEKKALEQAYTILSDYTITIIKPEGIDLSYLKNDFPKLTFTSFHDSYFEGIHGYNRLMLSCEFYKQFMSYQYILIYQLDAYVFKDELSEWCKKGFDYIGAPWLKKPVYKLPVINEFMIFVHWQKLFRGKLSKQSFYNKIGNGGFSLRKVESHYQATLVHKEKINFYLSQKRSHFYNEDIFWATEVPEFNYPEPLEAIKFSFDKYPAYCYKLNNKELPFGCHAWYKRKMSKFWKPIIGF
jgi:hypothetical protein